MQPVTLKWIYTQQCSAEERKTELSQCHHLIKITNLQASGRTNLKAVSLGSLPIYFLFLWSLRCSGKRKANRHGVLKMTVSFLHDALQTWEQLQLAKYVASDSDQKLMPGELGRRKERTFYGISLGSNPSSLPAVAQGLPTGLVTFSVFPFG